jgi:hypothetical protein
MNRLAGGVAGTALAGGEDKWYEDSAGLAELQRAQNREERPTRGNHPPVSRRGGPVPAAARGHQGHAATTCMMSWSGAITDICPQYINLVYPTGKMS